MQINYADDEREILLYNFVVRGRFSFSISAEYTSVIISLDPVFRRRSFLLNALNFFPLQNDHEGGVFDVMRLPHRALCHEYPISLIDWCHFYGRFIVSRI